MDGKKSNFPVVVVVVVPLTQKFATKGEKEKERKIKRDLATISDPVAYANTLPILIIGISSEKPRVRHALQGRESR